MPNHRRTALGSPKAKTPQFVLVDLGSWQSSNKAIESGKSLA
jgi:hypothetical protein